MATIAKLAVELDLDDSGFSRKLDSTRANLDKWGSNLRGWGTKLTAGVTTPIVGAGFAFVNWASDTEQAMGKSDAVFESSSGTVIEWSESTAKAYGFAQSESLAMAATYGSLFKVMGMSNEQAADYSMELIGLSADMAAFNDVSNDRASQALMAGLSGEYMSLRSMGVFLNEARVSEEALTIAMADGREEITEADKVQARYNLIMEQTAQQQGQAAKEADGWASSMAQVKAQAKDAGAALGRKLMPHALKLLANIEKLVEWFSKLSDKTQLIIIAIAAFAAALGPLLLIVGLMLPGLSALIGVIGFLVSPIGLVVIAIAALVAGLIYAYTHFEGFRDIVDSVASTIRDVAVAAFEKLVEVFEKLKEAFDAGGWSEMFATMGEMMLNGLQELSDLALEGLQALADRFVEALPGMLAAGASLLQSLWDGAVNIWHAFTGWLGGLAADAATWVADTTTTLLQKGADLIQGLWTAATTKWTEVTAWFGGLAADALMWVGDTASTLMQKGTAIIQGFFTAVTVAWTTVRTWFADMKNKAFIAIGATISTLKSRGTDILQGFWQGVLDKWTAVSLWFTNLPTMIFNAVANTTTTLKSRGTDILQGFWQGVLDKWIAVSTWFSSLGSMILGAVGNLGSSLYNAGVAVMNGLWDGLKAKWGDITNWLSGLNPADWKGPERRDKKMLYKPGVWIMDGLQRGLAEGWDDVTRQLSGYVPSIDASSFAGAPSLAGVRAGGTTVNNYYQQDVKVMTSAEWEAYKQKSDRGNQAYTHLSDPDSHNYGGGF